MGLNDTDNTLFEVINRSALIGPKSNAIIDLKRESMSYKDLVNQVNYTVGFLNGCGLSRNDRVAVILPNGPEMAVVFLGVSSCATCAPINPQIKTEELRFLLSDMRAEALVTSLEADSSIIGVADELGIKKILFTSDVTRAGRYSFDYEAHVNSESVYAYPNDTALILHTSGTTARPKMVPLTHTNLCQSARNISKSLDLTSNDLCLNVMPLFHIHGLIGCLLSNIIVGAATICSGGFQVGEFLGLLDSLKPTWYSAVPSIHQAILYYARENGDRIKHNLRFIRSCSAALPPQVMEDLEDLFGVPVVEAYGMTEASHQIAINPLPPKNRKPRSVGLASGVAVSIMSDQGKQLQAGELGEVVIKGPTVMKGYEDNPEANATTFVDGWFKTGDLGYIDQEGYIFLTDRIKEIINRGGEKISPREVDEVLLSHPSITQAVTFPIIDDKLGEEVAAAVVMRKNSDITEWDIHRYVATRLSSFKVPRRIYFVDEIPKSPTGKIQRKTMAQRLNTEKISLDSSRSYSEHREPTNEVEKDLVEIWSRVLKIKKIGIRDDYFALGGDSLRAEEIVTQISKRYGLRRIPIVVFIHAPTIEKMAILLSSDMTEINSTLVCMQPNGDKTPMYLVHNCAGEVVFLTDLVYNLGKERPIFAFRAPFLKGEMVPDNAIKEYSKRYLRELLKKQTEGPYILVGAGPGGQIALEMTHQLENAKVKVILIEALHPKSPINVSDHRRIDRVKEFIRSIPKQVYTRVRVRNILKNLASIVKTLSTMIVISRDTVSRMNNALRRYDPKKYYSPVLLIMAQTRKGYPDDPSVRIKELLLFLKGEVETHVIQGEHMDILKEPGARRIAEIINNYLKE